MSSDKSYAAEARLSALIAGIDTWHNLGSPASGWTVTGFAQYSFLAVRGLVVVWMQAITPPASAPADGTVIWTAANGLPAAYAPSHNTRAECYSNKTGTEQAAFEFESDGSIQVYGIGSVNPTRLDLAPRVLFVI